MYEKPELTRVGDAQDAILGCVINGGDIDLNWYPDNNQFEVETIEE